MRLDWILTGPVQCVISLFVFHFFVVVSNPPLMNCLLQQTSRKHWFRLASAWRKFDRGVTICYGREFKQTLERYLRRGSDETVKVETSFDRVCLLRDQVDKIIAATGAGIRFPDVSIMKELPKKYCVWIRGSLDQVYKASFLKQFSLYLNCEIV